MTTHPFDRTVALTGVADGVWRGQTDPAYANMVGPFGGTTAAAVLRAVELDPNRQGDPLSLTVNYLAPIVDGEFDLTTRCVRTNRTNQHWTVELSQGGEVKTNATAIFATRRDAWSDVEIPMPSVPDPAEVAEPDGQRFVAWINNYEMRFVAGALPLPDDGPSDASLSRLWVRDRPSRPLDFAALTAMCDVFYPRVFLRRGTAMPAGTISMTVYFHANAETLATHADDYVLASARALAFSQGYFDQTAQLFGETGVLLATSHQIVYYKG